MRIISLIILIVWTISVQSQNKITIKKTPQHVDTFAIEGDSLVISLSGDNKGKKKVFLSTGSGGSITYVPDIDSLRNYPGNTTKLVFVKGYWNGLQYGGGPFTWYATDITGRGDDRGISIKAPTGYWVRVDREFRATYFGMVDTSDLDIIEKYDNTWEAENLTNQIPDGEKLIFDPGFVFRTRGGFNWGYDNLKRIHVEGYGSTILRGSQIQDSVKSNSSTWVRVAHPERWDTFQYIALYDGTDRMSSPSKIWRINGDTLFASIGTENYATGDCYSQSFQMVFLKPECTLRGLTFDGNLDSNQIYNYWGTSGALYLSSPNSFINRITVKNSPGEGILLFDDNVILDGFNIQNCNGNGVHTGSNSNYQILNGVIKNVNNLIRRSNIETLGHEGGAIAHSLDVHGGMISNIQIDSAYAAIADVNGSDDSLNVYDRIDAKNCIKAVEFFQGYSQGTASYLKVTNSRFYNCGSFEIKSNPTGPADSSEYIRDVILDNVQLFNTYLNMNARSYNVTMNNIYIEDTSSTTYHIELSKHLKIDGLVKIGGGKIYASECNRAVLQNFEIRETNSTNSAIDFTYSGNAIIRNGAIYMTSAPSGFVGIYGGVANEINDVFIDLKGAPTYGIFANQSTTQVATTVKNCTILTPLGVPSIRCYGGSSGALFINNKMNNDISNISGNDAYGNINVTNDDVNWGNTTTLEILGKIRDSAGNLGTNGKALISDGSGFATWQTVGNGDITAVNVTGYLTGGGTSGDVTIGIDTTGTVGVATKYDLTTISTGGITTLNGLTAGTQTFATGTSGTDFNINSSTSTHTFNIPTASGTNRGLLSSSDHTTFSNKIGGSGSASRIPYFATSSTITGDEQWMVLNTTGNYIAGVGFTGGNSQFSNYLETGASGYVAYDASGIAGIGLATSSSNRWAMMNNSSGTLYWNRNSGGGWSGTPYMSLSSGGAFTLSDLAGSGTRMVVASSTGVLSTQAIPSAGVSSVSGTGTIIASPTTGAVTITDNQSAAASMFNPGAQTFTVSSTSPTLVNFTNSSANSPMTADATTDAITVPVTGRYVISYSATVRSDIVTGTGSPSNSFGIHINGTLNTNGTWSESGSPSGAYVNISKTVILNLNAGNVITLRHYSLAGTTYNTQIHYAHMSCQRVW